jgi:hypothetical protein
MVLVAGPFKSAVHSAWLSSASEQPAGCPYQGRGMRICRGVQVKQETVKLLGKGDMYYNPPEHPPITEPGKKALEAAHSYHKSLSGKKQGQEALMLDGSPLDTPREYPGYCKVDRSVPNNTRPLLVQSSACLRLMRTSQY